MRPYEAIDPFLDWYRASFCQNYECVEVTALNSGTVIMRNSAQPDRYAYFTREEFASFLRDAKAGKFNVTE
jgi:hypothetical protein